MAFSSDVDGEEGQQLVMISLDGLELVMISLDGLELVMISLDGLELVMALELQSLADALGGVAGDDANQSAS
jgi:hypothetical protein